MGSRINVKISGLCEIPYMQLFYYTPVAVKSSGAKNKKGNMKLRRSKLACCNLVSI